jgi:hypothetical protein
MPFSRTAARRHRTQPARRASRMNIDNLRSRPFGSAGKNLGVSVCATPVFDGAHLEESLRMDRQGRPFPASDAPSLNGETGLRFDSPPPSCVALRFSIRPMVEDKMPHTLHRSLLAHPQQPSAVRHSSVDSASEKWMSGALKPSATAHVLQEIPTIKSDESPAAPRPTGHSYGRQHADTWHSPSPSTSPPRASRSRSQHHARLSPGARPLPTSATRGAVPLSASRSGSRHNPYFFRTLSP